MEGSGGRIWTLDFGAEGGEEGGHVSGERSFEDHGGAGARVEEGETGGVEHLTVWTRDWELEFSAAPVLRVANNGVAKEGHMDADLVCAAGLDFHSEEGGVLEGFRCFVGGNGRASGDGSGAHTLAVARVTANQGFGAPVGGAGYSPDEGEVFLGDFAVPELADERGHGVGVFGDDHDAGCVPIQTMDDAGAFLATYSGEVWAMGEKGVYKGSRGMARGGVNN